jgi:hypothetical protein
VRRADSHGWGAQGERRAGGALLHDVGEIGPDPALLLFLMHLYRNITKVRTARAPPACTQNHLRFHRTKNPSLKSDPRKCVFSLDFSLQERVWNEPCAKRAHAHAPATASCTRNCCAPSQFSVVVYIPYTPRPLPCAFTSCVSHSEGQQEPREGMYESITRLHTRSRHTSLSHTRPHQDKSALRLDS